MFDTQHEFIFFVSGDDNLHWKNRYHTKYNKHMIIRLCLGVLLTSQNRFAMLTDILFVIFHKHTSEVLTSRKFLDKTVLVKHSQRDPKSWKLKNLPFS